MLGSHIRFLPGKSLATILDRSQCIVIENEHSSQTTINEIISMSLYYMYFYRYKFINFLFMEIKLDKITHVNNLGRSLIDLIHKDPGVTISQTCLLHRSHTSKLLIMVNCQFKIEYTLEKFVIIFRDSECKNTHAFCNLAANIKKTCPGLSHALNTPNNLNQITGRRWGLHQRNESRLKKL